MKTYAEKLKDPRWQRKRLEVMERDGFCCTICQDSEITLNVHHCYYGKRRDPWDYDLKHLITLCQVCHVEVEKKREEILKEMTWEIPIESIHALATCGDPWLLSGIACAFKGAETKGALRSRAGAIRKAIYQLESIAHSFELDEHLLHESAKPKFQRSSSINPPPTPCMSNGMSVFDSLIESAPEQP